MSWQESLHRVLAMRRAAGAEADRAELIRIIQELEKRCQVVVNREASAVLKDVPSWKSHICDCGGQINPKSGEFIHTTDCCQQIRKQPRFRGGIRTWAEIRRQKEKAARAGTDKLKRRTKEFEQVLSGRFGTENGGKSMAVHSNGQLEIKRGEYPTTDFDSDGKPIEEKSDVESAST